MESNGVYQQAINYLNSKNHELPFLVAMKNKIQNGGTLSEKMVNGILNCQRFESERRRNEQPLQPQFQEWLDRGKGNPIPTGRQVVSGVIQRVYSKNRHGDNPVLKMWFLDRRGFLINCTVPVAIIDTVEFKVGKEPTYADYQGEEFTFTVGLKQNVDDPQKAWGRNPQAVRVGIQEAAAPKKRKYVKAPEATPAPPAAPKMTLVELAQKIVEENEKG